MAEYGYDDSYFVDKVSVVIALAPVTRLNNTRHKTLIALASSYDVIEPAFSTLGVDEVLGKSWG
jgi:hypothetical protein